MTATNSLERLAAAREQVEILQQQLSVAKLNAQKAKATYDSASSVQTFRSLKKELEFWKDETRRIGLEVWTEMEVDDPTTGVQIQHGRTLEVTDEEKLQGWAKDNLPKAITTALDMDIIKKYAELVEEAPAGTHFVDTHKVIIRKIPEKEVE